MSDTRKRSRLSTTAGTGGIWCPFFRAHNSTIIACEGPTDDCVLQLRYRSAEAKKQQQTIFCEGNHRNCEIYRMLMEYKYPKEDY